MKKLAIFLFLLVPSLASASFEYDGTGDGHVANNPNGGNATTFSICFWVKIASIADDTAVVSYGNGIDSSAGRGFEISTKTDGRLRFDTWAGGVNNQSSTTVTLSDATQHHVCWTRNGVFTNKFYLDATNATADDTLSIDAGTVQDSTDDLAVGQPMAALTGYGRSNLTGRVAHVAYWDVELTGAEVASLADKSTCPTAVQASNLKVFLPLTATPATETAQALSVTENGNPTFQTDDPTGLPCASTSNLLFLNANGDN